MDTKAKAKVMFKSAFAGRISGLDIRKCPSCTDPHPTVPTPGIRPLMLWMKMKKKSPVKSQKDGKNAFFPTIGCKMERRAPMIDSTMICPFPGTNLGFPTVKRITQIIKIDTTQLVTMELVTGNPRSNPRSISSAFLWTSPAANRDRDEVANRKTGRSFFNSKRNL